MLSRQVYVAVVFQGLGADKSIESDRELFFDDMRVPVANLLGGVEGKGFYQLMGRKTGRKTGTEHNSPQVTVACMPMHEKVR
jgi:hypothetical protein